MRRAVAAVVGAFRDAYDGWTGTTWMNSVYAPRHRRPVPVDSPSP